MTIGGSLSRITTALDRVGIPYMLTGSFASSYYGAPRASQDIDFVIEAAPDQLRALVQLFPSDKYYVDLNTALEANRRGSMFNVLDLTSGWKTDLIFRKTRPFSMEEFHRRTRITLDGVPVFAATPEDVIISKLEWARLSQTRRHIDDVARILRTRRHVLDDAYLGKWIGDLGLGEEWRAAKSAAE
jgi:hypothetical protein